MNHSQNVEAKQKKKEVQNEMPMLTKCPFVYGLCCCFFFFFFVFQLIGLWFCGLLGSVGVCLECVVSGRWTLNLWDTKTVYVGSGGGPNGIRWCEDMYERSYVFCFCATKKPKQQKTVEKGKISVFSLEWNCCCGGCEWNQRRVILMVVNVQERANKSKQQCR